MNTKICSKCNKELPIDLFYRQVRNTDGHQGKCKSCTIIATAANPNAKLNDRRRELTSKRKAWKKNYLRLLRKKYPQRDKARALINRMVRSGKLVRQKCVVVGCDKVGEAHHQDYSKPLSVIWLCRFHHMELHSQNKLNRN